MKTRKSNSYFKIILILLAGAAAGGVFGLGMYFMVEHYGHGIEYAAAQAFHSLQMAIFPVLIVITVLSVIAGESVLKKLREIMGRLLRADDEEADRLDYEEEKYAALSTSLNIFSQTLCFIFLSLGYSSNYLNSSDAARGNFLYACLVFIICMLYDCFWQIRYVKLVQKIYPERKGDPSSKKFQEQWLESCDEAEREVIYRSAYRTYLTLGKLIPVLLLVTMLSNLFFNTGILAVLIVAVIWLISTISYTRSCVALKEEKALLK